MDKITPEVVLVVLSTLIVAFAIFLHTRPLSRKNDHQDYMSMIICGAGICFYLSTAGYAYYAGLTCQPGFLLISVVLFIFGTKAFMRMASLAASLMKPYD